MEEKLIIKSKQYNVKKILKIAIIIGLVFLFCDLIFEIYAYVDEYNAYQNHLPHSSSCYETEYIYDYDYSYYGGYTKKIVDSYEVLDCSYKYGADFEWFRFFVIGFSPLVVFSLLALLIKFWLSSYEMIVTDRRIYGRVAWGKRVDLPLDSISATATLRVFKGVSVSTASGRIKFLLIKNSDEMYEEINKLLIERQKKETPTIITAENKTDTSDDLIKLKELLDKEIITQEEFDAKKKQILGL